VFRLQEALKHSEWMDLKTFMKFNKLAGILDAAFGRVDPTDLFKALSTLPSELLEVRETGEGSFTRSILLSPYYENAYLGLIFMFNGDVSFHTLNSLADNRNGCLILLSKN
jgi:hypothetical protein